MLEEMPPFPERESSILAKLKKKKPTVTKQAENKEPKQPMPQAQMSNNVNTHTPPPVSQEAVKNVQRLSKVAFIMPAFL